MVNPWKTYVKLSAVLMGSHGLTKGSLAYLNYPAQLMFKSTKVPYSFLLGYPENNVSLFIEEISSFFFKVMTLSLLLRKGSACDDNGSVYPGIEEEIPIS